MSIEASGNMGAICYSRWRELQIARDVWTGTYPGTTKQLAVNAIMKTVSQAWGGTLTAEEREMWAEVARSQTWKDRLSGDFTPTGYQLYCKQNLQSKNIAVSNPLLKVPPLLPNPVFVRLFEAKNSVAYNAIFVMMDNGYHVKMDCDGFQVFKAGPYVSGGRRAIEGEYRWLMNCTLTTGVCYDYDVIDTKWYWYWARWYFDEGFVGNKWLSQVKVAF